MTNMGFSVLNLVFTFVMSLVILLLMFAFIFVGISAFSPSSSFSSVTNSLLPLGAGAAVNQHSSDTEKKQEDLQDAVDAHPTFSN